jgi:hypothetical protein
MAYTPLQRRVIRGFDRAADRLRSPLRHPIALYEAGRVESNFSNPTEAQSDADSAGALQERRHYGSQARRRNPYKAAEYCRFRVGRSSPAPPFAATVALSLSMRRNTRVGVRGSRPHTVPIAWKRPPRA